MEYKYIVCWVEEVGDKKVDNYEVFIDGTTEQNYDDAKKVYKNLKKDKTVYSANLAKIIKSTDYDVTN